MGIDQVCHNANMLTDSHLNNFHLLRYNSGCFSEALTLTLLLETDGNYIKFAI